MIHKIILVDQNVVGARRLRQSVKFYQTNLFLLNVSFYISFFTDFFSIGYNYLYMVWTQTYIHTLTYYQNDLALRIKQL
jgi:hypothetical protein